MDIVGVTVLVSRPEQTTTRQFQNALAAHIPQNAFIICVGVAGAPQLTQPNVLFLQTRRPHIEGHGEMTLVRLVEHALAMGAGLVDCG